MGTFIPSISFSKEAILIITAVLGTTISPYLFFWQTSQEVEEQILEGKVTVASRQGTNKEEISQMRADVWTGMFFSNLVMFCIIAVCGATLYAHGITTIETAAQAASALKPFAGNAAYILFALGIIGTGFLAIPVLAGSTSYAFAESFGWKEGLYRKWSKARAFYGMIIVSVGFGLLLNFLHIDPIKALIYSAVLNGLIAPVVIYFIVHLASNGHIMGEFKNSRWYTFIGYVAFGIMVLASVATIISFFV
jgi:Mn2+/Fe2+ NRAMP family transporter